MSRMAAWAVAVVSAGDSRIASRRWTSVVALGVVLVWTVAAKAQNEGLVAQAVQIRVDQQQLQFLSRTQQISPQEVQARNQAVQARDRELRQVVSRLPRPQQGPFWQQVNSRSAAVLQPLQQQWNAQAAELQRQRQAARQNQVARPAAPVARPAPPPRAQPQPRQNVAALSWPQPPAPAPASPRPNAYVAPTRAPPPSQAPQPAQAAAGGTAKPLFGSINFNFGKRSSSDAPAAGSAPDAVAGAGNPPSSPSGGTNPPVAGGGGKVDTAKLASSSLAASGAPSDGDSSRGAPSARSSGDLFKSDSLTDPKTAAALAGAKRYALFFASDDYQFSRYKKLSNPISDAKAVAKDLETLYGFQTEIVSNPTYASMRAKLIEYQKEKVVKFGVADEFLIYFAGHGKFDEVTKEGYVVAKDSSDDDYPHPAFTHTELQNIIDGIPAEHILVVLDVCFGGTFDTLLAMAEQHRGLEPGQLTRSQFIERKLRYRSRLYLTSGGKEYVPDGRPGQNSPFTRALLGILRQAGGDDHVLTFDEIRVALQKLDPSPRGGSFASNAPGGDFIFVAKP